ncbi:acetyl-CoA hydrolase/transferase family protein [bacterium]|nr:acetyl-CoA hydrolase/transferase family protein [candidate division CSSED10-310 bacterium]
MDLEQQGLNSVQRKRGQPFDIEKYPPPVRDLIREKLRPVDAIVAGLPRSFKMYTTFAICQGRGFLRALGRRKDWEYISYKCALTLEPYSILKNPHVDVTSAYLSPLDRLVAEKMGKTVAHLPRQFIQFGETLREDGIVDLFVHTATPPDRNGYVNLGLNCETVPGSLRHFKRTGKVRVILEINCHMPWVMGHEDSDYNRWHLSDVDCIYENHQPLPELPPLKVSGVEQRIAENVLPYIEDGDTIQLGIGGVPNYIAEHLRDRRDLKIHSEMITDSMVDLVECGAVTNHGKPYMDGLLVGSFAAGTNKLYDWLDRNPRAVLLPITATNDSHVIARHPCMKSINSGVTVDLFGQVCSDAVSYKQISGIGGQLEFVVGAQLSPGGRSILCIKSCSTWNGARRSNIVCNLPPGSPVTVPRQYADVIVTEYGAAELKHLDSIERAHALIAIAHPDCRDDLRREAGEAGLLTRRPGFDTFMKRAIYNNLPYVIQFKQRLSGPPLRRAGTVLAELRRLAATPNLLRKIWEFYTHNRS